MSIKVIYIYTLRTVLVVVVISSNTNFMAFKRGISSCSNKQQY